ncbi:MAG TPA: hypothetical protein VJO33_04745 [Gemmatimonadaceae bacterium]|nr:hypothetical protein [Gemmatimonadaceae bacterium]
MRSASESQSAEHITVANFQLATALLTLFTPDEEISAAKIVTGLLPKWEKFFDGEPVVLPQAAGWPREVPRLVLRNKEGTWRCEVSSARMNIVWDSSNTEQTQTAADVVKTATPYFNEYCDFVRCRTGRLAAVINRYCVVPSPGLFLARHFCQPRWLKAPLNRPESFELHAHKRYAFPTGDDVNSWVRNKTALLTVDSKPIVLVEQDLNTLAENVATKAFSSAEVERFFLTAVSEFDNILALYYPPSDA